MKNILLFIWLLGSFSTSWAQKSMEELLNMYNTRSIPYISVEELRMEQNNGDIIILDTRELREFEVSHIPTSTCVGYDDFSAEKISEEIEDKDTPIIVYCSVGIRSEQVGEKLKKVGFTNVQNLYGGIFEWKNKDYPVVNSRETETDSVHTFSKPWSKWLNKGVKVH